MIKRIGVLTSGGDSQGMNAAVAGVIKAARTSGIEAYIVRDGYLGLVNNWIEPAGSDFADSIMKLGGTVIGSARLPEFKEVSVREKAVANLKANNIEALVVIGGDGSYQGALRLTEMGINCIGLPGTIDNDIASSDFTIGFDTAINIVVESVDRVRDTMQSHNRAAIIEVMGRHCGDIALYAGVATGVDVLSVSECPLTEDEIVAKVQALKAVNKRSVIVLVTENLYDCEALAKKVEAGSGYITRPVILGHVQRGGTPTAMDRYNAFTMAIAAVEELKKGNGGLCIGLAGSEIVSRPIAEALAMPRVSRKQEIDVMSKLMASYGK